MFDDDFMSFLPSTCLSKGNMEKIGLDDVDETSRVNISQMVV